VRTTLSVVVICLLATVAFAAAEKFQPLKVKTGLWQMTETIKWSGLPPEMAAAMKAGPATRTYKTCVTEKDLNSNPWAEGSGHKCDWSVLHSTGTDMEVQGKSCDIGSEYGMKADVHMKIHVQDSGNGTGSMAVTLTGNGQTMDGTGLYTGKWIGAKCPADVN
jgi:Protein of unknown function (DUF3617)